MKKLILSLMIVLLLPGVSFARNAERQQSEFYEGAEVIKSSAGTVFSVTVSATASNGWTAVYDVSSISDITSSTEPKIEIQTATQYNTEIKEFPSGLKFYNGITIDRGNSQGVVYYY